MLRCVRVIEVPQSYAVQAALEDAIIEMILDFREGMLPLRPPHR